MEVIDYKPVILQVLQRWTALRLMVDHSLGGQNSFQKALQLAETINQAFLSNKSIENEDLEDLIYDYMFNECNTTLEDDSQIDVAQDLIKLCSTYKNSGVLAVEELLKSHISLQDRWLEQAAPVPKLRNQQAASSSDESGSEDDAMETDSNHIQNGSNNGMIEDSDWTTVSYKRK